VIDAREADQNGGIADVVVRQVVNIGVSGEQFGAIIEINADDKRVGFRCAIGRDTCQELSINLQSWDSVGRALLNPGQL